MSAMACSMKALFTRVSPISTAGARAGDLSDGEITTEKPVFKLSEDPR
jgi:hypothetical protein